MTSPLDAPTVAQYLSAHPHFFEEQAGLLGEIRLASPLTGRAISLQERQMEVMRAKYKALELRMADLLRVANENEAIAARVHGWTQALLQVRGAAGMPDALVQGLQTSFAVPQVTLRLWNLAPEHADSWFARGVSDDARIFANSLRTPYCGSNHDFEAVRWLAAAETIASTVILPLRAAGAPANGPAFGLLILGSPDAERFTASMATDFLTHIGAIASAALGALQA